MNAVAILIVRHARDARVPLVTAPLVSTVVLAAVHAWFAKPIAVAEASATAAAVLAVLWTLYFAADAFAGDSSSGRLATLALLPVSALTLWCARISFVALAAVAQVAWILGAAWGLQLGLGDDDSLALLANRLGELAAWLPVLAALASAAILSSLLVESALAAMISSLLLIGALSLAAYPIVRALILVGVAVEPSGSQISAAASSTSALLLAVGAFAFVRGQRRLGSRAVRLVHASWPLGATLIAGGLATAAAVHRRIGVELEDPMLRYVAAASSSDGRVLALEGERDLPGNDDPPYVVWLVDIDNGERELVGRPGRLVRDRYTNSALEWTPESPLRVLGLSLMPWRNQADLIEVELDGAPWTVRSHGVDWRRDDVWRPSRVVPPWARITTDRANQTERSTTVHWIDRGIAARFEDAMPAREVLPTPEPGVVLALRDDRLVLLDMESGDERVVLDSDVPGLLWPSPDGSAVMVRGKQTTHVLESSTGMALHEPWDSGAWGVRWVDASDASRAVELVPLGARHGATRIVDLDLGTSFEIERDPTDPLLHRIGSRGYVFVRADGDLVRVDLEGELVEILVDR